MRLKLFTLTFFIIFQLSQSLGQDFAPVGAKWHYTEQFAFSGDISYLWIESVGDTIIKGKNCKILVNNGGLMCSFHNSNDYVYSEDSIVYFYVPQIDSFQILYNLRAQKDSSWTVIFGIDMVSKLDTVQIVVNSVSYTTINDKKLKKFHVTYKSQNAGYENMSYDGEIIEKIGDISYLFNFYSLSGIVCDGNYSGGLRCYEDPEFGFYSTEIAESCTYTYNWYDYLFGATGTEWYYNGNNGGAAPSESEYLWYKSVKDTIILNSLCFKIERTYYKYNGTIESLPPYFVALGTTQVLLYNPNVDKFDLLYRFNVSKGDTITLDIPYELQQDNAAKTYRLVIDSVVSEVYNGLSLKKYKTRAIDDFGGTSEWYMDKVGGLDWFIPRGAIIPEADGPLRCYHDNKVDINFVNYPCDYRRVSIIDTNFHSQFSVSPNPCKDKIDIQIQYPKLVTLELRDVSGRILQQKSFELSVQLDISGYQNGIYLITLKNGSEILGFKKVVKN